MIHTTPRMPDLTQEAVELTRALVRVDTSNPPGNETAAAVVLRDWLAARGVQSELIGPDPDRLNLVASLDGVGEGPSIALCGHLDVVPAGEHEHWEHGPFSGDLVDGYVWGRGTVDMKGQVATRAAALAAFAQAGVEPRGTIRLISQADEEVNTAGVGMSWIVRARPDLRTDWALEEGGGRHLDLPDGRSVVLYGVADKALFPLELVARGPGGHASRPGAVRNPVLTLARLLAALEQATPHRLLTSPAERMLRGLAGSQAPAEGASADELLAATRALVPEMAPGLDAITRNTFTPTGLEASRSINVIPPEAIARIDCRALPGQTDEDVLGEVAAALAVGAQPLDDWGVHAAGAHVGGSHSEPDERFTAACQRALGAVGSHAELVPVMNPFYTDADHLRRVWGTTTYGLWPWRFTPPEVYQVGVHAANERLLAQDIGFAAAWHLELLLDLAER